MSNSIRARALDHSRLTQIRGALSLRQADQAVRRSLTLFGSEPQLQCEFECPPVVEGVRDLSEIVLAQGLPGLGELGVIEEIQRFSTEQHGAVTPQ